MAVVYRALDRTLGRQVAIKVLREQFAADPEFVERFDREARSAARLSHPNIVDIYDVGADGETRFIVMELVEGENLKSLIRRGGALPPALVIGYGREVGAALEYAHRRGIVHRDVKPQNVLLDADGHAKLTDFGIAQAAESVGLTQTGVLGTPQYMSPEQARGRGVGPASDVYSLGVVLYELATGRLPFQADSPLAIALRHVEDEPPAPRSLNPSVPPALEAVILRALAKAPAERFASAADLVDALNSGVDPVRERTTRVAPVPPAPPRRPAVTTRVAPVAPPPVRRSATGRPAPVGVRRSGSGLGGTIVLLLLILASLGMLALGFNWLFGASRNGSPAPTPTATAQAKVVVPPSPATATASATPPPATATVPTATATATAPPATATAEATATPAPTPTRPPASPTARPTAPPTATAAPSRVAVPRLVGLNLGEAQQQLGARNLIMEFEAGNDPGKPEGIILEQNPREGAMVAPRSVVRLVVNRLTSGMLVSVPNVLGQEAGQARRTLQEAGLKVSVDEIERGSKGVVNDQSPEPGARVPPGSEVRIAVGS
jgi:serine/threonine-protein kinase